jgi:hypothetical protein
MMDVITNPFCLMKLVGTTDVFDVSCTSYVDVFRILLMTFDRARADCSSVYINSMENHRPREAPLRL